MPSPLLVVTDRASLRPPTGSHDGSRLGEAAIVAHGSPLPEGEGQGEVRGSSGEVTHLTPTLSFQEKGPAATDTERPARHPTDGLPTRDPRGPSEEGLALAGRIDALLAGGARWVWFRERDLAPGPRRILARAVLARVRAHGGVLSIGGDAALAAELGADGVHLPGGATPADLAAARLRLPDGLIGVSAHSLGEVAMASRHGADYATLSPIFATASKPGYGPPLGPEALADASAYGLPVIALGGITDGTIRPCRDAGAAGVAVMGGPMRSADPGGYARAVLDAWGP